MAKSKNSILLLSVMDSWGGGEEVLLKIALHVDEVITASMLENKTALTLLTMLELNGHIKHLGNHVYAAI